MVSRKKEAILEVSKRLFIVNGIEETSVEEIAASVPVSKMTIYNTFGNKEGLLEAVIDQMIIGGNDRFEKAIAEASDPLDAFRKFASYRGIETEISKKFLDDLNEKYAVLMKKLIDAANEAMPHFQRLILDAQQKGQIRQDLSPIVITSFIRYLKEFTEKSEELNAFGNPEMFREQITSILYYGILSNEEK